MLKTIKIFQKLFFGVFILLLSGTTLFADIADTVKVIKSSQGSKLKVNGKDFYVKGMVWGYSPRDENYAYNLWNLPNQDIKNVIDHDFGLMKKAGVNAIRSFATIPPKWIKYINKNYQIKTVINPLMGRYGATVNGRYITNVDYSDPATRKTLKKQVLNTIKKYKDVPGVIIFALGNESNYGLSWKSFEIENLPKGEQNTARAEYLYSLFAETIKEGKSIDPKHPITIVNGDIQYIDLIAKYGKEWELLGVNAYRGKNFTPMWKDVKRKLNIPILFFEFGSDAYDARKFKEDQVSQAKYLKNQWKDMYKNSYAKGYGNSLGGFVFEWRDEWWKYTQTENLDMHDRTASWSNGGYKFDYVDGKNNMNEEWFGVMRLGQINKDGVYIAQPRIAYDVLSSLWKIDPLSTDMDKINRFIDAVDIQNLKSKSQKRDEENGWGEETGLRITGGSVKLESISRGYDTFNPNKDENDRDITELGQSAFIDLAYDSGRFSADMSVNVIGKAANSDFQQRYEDRVADNNEAHVEIYDFKASYNGELMDINAFYHVPRYHWGDEGDFFGLVREVTDMEGQDIWNAKAPYGIEYIGKQEFDGLRIVAGKEIYWGANPKVVVKYQFGENKKYTIMHSQDYDTAEGSTLGGTVTPPKTSQTTLYGKFNFDNGMILELGGIVSGTEKIDDRYNYIKNGQTYNGTVDLEDTLGVKGKLSFTPYQNVDAYVSFNYAGLVANAGQPFKEMGTELPYSEFGNKIEFDAGVKITEGDYTIFPRILYRDNLEDANPLIAPSISGTTLTPGIVPRNILDDPFAVLSNRAARAAEVYLTYDPTPETYFYEWDNDLRENAGFAYNLGITYIDYPTRADAEVYYDNESGGTFPFATGLDAEEVWLLKSKLVFNSEDKSKKLIMKLEAGKQQSTGLAADAITYGSIESKLILNQQNIFSLKFAKDKWGPYDFHRQFNTTYPEQWELGYTRLLEKGLKEKSSSQFGIKFFYRTLDKGSEGEWTRFNPALAAAEFNDDMYELQVYYTYRFR